MQGNLSLSPRAKQAYGNFQHLAAASPPGGGDSTAGSALSRSKGRSDCRSNCRSNCALARVVDALFGVQALSRHTLALPRHVLSITRRRPTCTTISVMEVGSQNCVVEIPRSRL